MMMEFDRRHLLRGGLAASAAALARAHAQAQDDHGVNHTALPHDPGKVDVFEITMAAPDIVLVEVRDPAIRKGELVGPLNAPESDNHDVWIMRINPATGAREHCQIVGPEKRHLKFADKPATTYLNRPEAKNARGYGLIGGRKVTAIYYKAMPYDEGVYNSRHGGPSTKAVSMKHFLYLKLDGNLPEGAHSVRFPEATGLGSRPFVFDSASTRCSSLRANQVGHRPADAGKTAYLSLWLPGYADEGAVNFRSDYPFIDAFEVIDSNKKVVFTGRIAPRIGPREPEFTLEDQLVRYVSTTRPPKNITGISNDNPAVVTCPGHGFTTGEIKHFRGTRMRGVDLEKFPVTVIDANHFSIPVDTRAAQRWSRGHYLEGYDNLVYDTYLANRSATYVYGLDYGSWTGAPGIYRVRVPGLGVSYPFRVDENVWLDVAQNSVKGFYHQLNGVELDGRYGFKRPAPFRDGVNGVQIFKSTLPGAFSSEGVTTSPNIDSGLGGLAPWITKTRAFGIYGSVMDAGDWDSFIYAHAPACHHLLDICVEFLPARARATSFGFPRSTELLDPQVYAGTDTMPDAFHQAAYLFDFYRRLQNDDGSVGSGIGYASKDGNGGGGSLVEPSYVSRQQAFIYAPDHASNFAYAGGAAKMAIVCEANGYAELARVWRDSAMAAWRWAEPIYQNRSGERDAYYVGALSLKVKARWSDEQYAAALPKVQRAARLSREFAAGCLFRLTGDRAYAEIIEREYVGGLHEWSGDALWEYINARGANPRFKKGYVDHYLQTMYSWFVEPAQKKIAYKNLYRRSVHWIGTGAADVNVLRAFLLTKDAKFLKVFQDGQGFGLGANQNGMCMTTGLGSRNNGGPSGVLHRDRQAMGVPQPDGVTSYTWWPLPGGGIVVLNFAEDVPFNYLVEQPTGKHESTWGTKRIVEPYRLSWPVMEAYFENTFMIYMTEYTFHQKIVPAQTTAMLLHAWDK